MKYGCPFGEAHRASKKHIISSIYDSRKNDTRQADIRVWGCIIYSWYEEIMPSHKHVQNCLLQLCFPLYAGIIA